MRGLSVRQPWASLIAAGAKRIETRSWATLYRGPLAIHASALFRFADRGLVEREPYQTALAPEGGVRWAAELPLGAIVAVCRLVNVVPMSMADVLLGQGYHRCPHERAFGDYSPGRYAWLLDDVRALREPVECPGALGLWKVGAALAESYRCGQPVELPDGPAPCRRLALHDGRCVPELR